MQIAPSPLSPRSAPRFAARVAVLIDAENISPACADMAMEAADGLGMASVRRVYRNAGHASARETAPGFRTVHTGDARGRNAADMALAIDAVALALGGMAEAFVLVTSDADFTGLALWLREHGFPVIGVGEAKAPQGFRAACGEFREVPPSGAPAPACPPCATPARAAPPGQSAPPAPPRKVLEKVDTLLRAQEGDGWLRLSTLSQTLRSQHGVQISSTRHRTWRKLLESHPDRYQLEPPSVTARVRLVQRAQ